MKKLILIIVTLLICFTACKKKNKNNYIDNVTIVVTNHHIEPSGVQYVSVGIAKNDNPNMKLSIAMVNYNCSYTEHITDIYKLETGTYIWTAMIPYNPTNITGTCTLASGQTTNITVQ